MSSFFEGKNFLVFGANSGIGLETVKQLKEAGAEVWGTARSETSEIEGAGATALTWDATQPEELNGDLPDELHGVVYAVGTIRLKPFQSLKMDDFQEDLQINYLGAIGALKAACKPLRAAKGASVVLYSTVAVDTGLNFHSSISGAKGAVQGLATALSAEWAKASIRVNTIAPSIIDTPLASSLLGSDDKRQASADRHPLAKVGSAKEMAQSTLYLLGEGASWMTGQVLRVDGGMSSVRQL